MALIIPSSDVESLSRFCWSDATVLLLNPMASEDKIQKAVAANAAFKNASADSDNGEIQSSRLGVVASVDHFVQVELLQRQAVQIGTVMPVMVSVNSGAHYFGCRPGTEACELANAIAGQSMLSFKGLMSEVPADRCQGQLSSDDPAIAALKGTQKQLSGMKLTGMKIGCEILYLRLEQPVDLRHLPEGWYATEFEVGESNNAGNGETELNGLHSQTGMQSRAMQPHSMQPHSSAIAVKATVVSRPSKLRAVLVLQDWLSKFPDAFTIQSIQQPVEVLHADWPRCAVQLNAETSNLRIGQHEVFVAQDADFYV